MDLSSVFLWNQHGGYASILSLGCFQKLLHPNLHDLHDHALNFIMKVGIREMDCRSMVKQGFPKNFRCPFIFPITVLPKMIKHFSDFIVFGFYFGCTD